MRVKEKIQRLANTSDRSLGKEAGTAADLATMLKSLDPLRVRVTKLKSLMTSYGEHIDKLPKPEFLNIIKSFIVTEGKHEMFKPKLYAILEHQNYR